MCFIFEGETYAACEQIEPCYDMDYTAPRGGGYPPLDARCSEHGEAMVLPPPAPSGHACACRRVPLFALQHPQRSPQALHHLPWAPEELADDVNSTSIEASKWAGVLSTVPDRAAIATTTAP